MFKAYNKNKSYNNFLIELDKKQTLLKHSKKFKTKEVYVVYSEVKEEKAELREAKEVKVNQVVREEKANQVLIEAKKLREDEVNQVLNKAKNLSKEEAKEEAKEAKEEAKLKVKVKVNIEFKVERLYDLIKLIETYPDDENVEYNIDISLLHKIKLPLIELYEMIGMKELKTNILYQILFYIQNLHNTNNDFMHTVIYGPPGTGKTHVAKLIGSIFSKMGILSKDIFKKVTRADLIAGYLGQTALKTRDVINSSLGGVLFIDEAYSLGNDEKKDNFSKECIDTLCDALSEHKDNLMVIIAGYENELNSCFFAYNCGLQSRFTWRYKIDEYNAEELYFIFLKQVKDNNWSMDDNSINIKWFEKNKSHFKYYGRDIETLFAKTKIAHSKRVFGLDINVKKIITIVDINNGLELYLNNENKVSQKIISSMYI
jgi:SpoVK/Ycf46/Vps4 family AAA+-type ATPase